MYVCLYVSLYVCRGRLPLAVCDACVYVCVYIYEYVRMFVRMYMYVSMCVNIRVLCVFVCM